MKRPVFTVFLTIRKNLDIYYNRTNFSIVLKGIWMKTIVCKMERKPLNKINLLQIQIWPLRLDASRAGDVGERKMISFIAKENLVKSHASDNSPLHYLSDYRWGKDTYIIFI